MKKSYMIRRLVVLLLLPFFCVEAFQTTTPATRRASLALLSSTSTTTTDTTTKTSIDPTILSKLLSEDRKTQTKLSFEQVQEYNSLIDSLPSPSENLNIDGGWKLLATISPDALNGDNVVDFFDINSWQNYIQGTGPSPFQSLVTGSSNVNGLTQWLTSTNFDNVVEFHIGPILQGKLVLKASLEDALENKRIFKFQLGFFILKTIWNSVITIPYPVPFQLLGDRAIGSLQTIGYDPKSGIRAAIGNKGTKFIFQRIVVDNDDNNDDDTDNIEKSNGVFNDIEFAYQSYIEKIEHDTVEEEKIKNHGLTKRPIIICPQQFGGKPGDYTKLAKLLRDRNHPVYLVRLSTLDWLSIIKSAFSKAYIKGELQPSVTLPFYMKAINDTVSKLQPHEEYSILCHSIGGWIVRAWLGEVASEEVRRRCVKYVSLGTPHLPPPENSLVSKVDQTRGLLSYINTRWPGAYYDDIEYTCIASKGVTGKIGFDLDSILAYASYLALAGSGNIDGDGITPVEAALLEGSNHIVLDDVYHADVLPNPIGNRNTKLVGCKWYANEIDEWIEAL